MELCNFPLFRKVAPDCISFADFRRRFYQLRCLDLVLQTPLEAVLEQQCAAFCARFAPVLFGGRAHTSWLLNPFSPPVRHPSASRGFFFPPLFVCPVHEPEQPPSSFPLLTLFYSFSDIPDPCTSFYRFFTPGPR